MDTIHTSALRLSRGDQRIGALISQAQQAVTRLNPQFRALSHLVDDAGATISTLQQELDAGLPRSALHGLAVTIKGNIPVHGLPWTEGSAVYGDRVAKTDGDIVARVRRAGGVVLGTTTLSELAMYAVENAFEPMGLNPWDVERTAGGSSTGAGVATALGMAQLSIGTDSGGSVRNPACHCGVVGFMPRIGGLSLLGQASPTQNPTPSLTSVGVLTRSVDDAELAWAALAEAPGSRVDAPARRLLVPRRLIETACDEATLALFDAACGRLRAAGFALIDGEIEGWIEGEQAAGVASLAECAQALASMDLTHAGEAIRDRARLGAQLSPSVIDQARQARSALRSSIVSTLAATATGAVLTPTWPFPAPLIHAQTVEIQGRSVRMDPLRSRFVRAANAIAGCAITLPMGLYPRSSVPGGLHLTAPAGQERLLLALARCAESALPALPPAPPSGIQEKGSSTDCSPAAPDRAATAAPPRPTAQ